MTNVHRIAAPAHKIITKQFGVDRWNVYIVISGNSGSGASSAVHKLVGYVTRAQANGQFQFTAFTTRNVQIGTPKFMLVAAAALLGKTIKGRR